MNTNTVTAPQIHIRYEGRSWDIPLNDLDVGVLSTDEQVRTAVATHLNVPLAKLRGFAVDEATGELTLRPEAVFG